MRKKIINRILNLIGFEIKKVNTGIFKKRIWSIPKSDYKIDKKKICFFKLSLELPINQASPLIDGYHHAINIVEKVNGKFTYYNESIVVEIDGIKFFVNDVEELFILNEIFIEGCYNFMLDELNIVAIDIGMNVGIASLFFANKKNVKKVYSYELFPYTYNLAIKNIQLNLTREKIISHSFGLGSYSNIEKLEYSIKEKGRMGLYGLPVERKYEKKILQDVQIIKASTEIEKIISENKNAYFVCKVDCEGAEFDIIKDLEENQQLDKINLYMIEWHYRNPIFIIELLKRNGFIIFYTLFQTGISGMIYAVKRFA